ncbi:hypothetical protein B0J17DRAFT_772521 [Rhizoctonia solani]|nr:hypothetical protein B0J17DRAFT_772521 [Rhizoctonia solani]
MGRTLVPINRPRCSWDWTSDIPRTEQPIYRLSPMSTTRLTASVTHHYSPLPGKHLTRLPYIRQYFNAPEVIPLVGVVICSLGMGAYLSQGAARKSAVQSQPRTQSWFQTPSEPTLLSSSGGLRQAIQKELKNSIDSWNWISMCLEQV